MCHSTQCRRHARQWHGHVDTVSHGASRQDSEKHSLRLEVGLRVGTRLLLQQHPRLMITTIFKVSGRRRDMMCPHSSAQHAHESVGVFRACSAFAPPAARQCTKGNPTSPCSPPHQEPARRSGMQRCGCMPVASSDLCRLIHARIGNMHS